MARRILFAGLFWLFAGAVSAQTHGPDVRYPIQFIVSPPVREMHPKAFSPEPLKDKPMHRPYGKRPTGSVVDPVVQTSALIATAQTLGQFEGLGAGYPGFSITAVPPDPNIAVGPNHIVQWVNNAFVVFDKRGNQIQAPIDDGTFWGAMSTCNQLGGFSDPIVQYDRMADRWLIGEVAIPALPGFLGQYAQCFAVSTTSDPTGSYYLWAYGFDPNIDDYPKIAVWPDGYYVTWNIFNGGGNFIGPEACAFDRIAMVNGVAAPAFVCFTLGGTFASLLPSDLDGTMLPPAGSPNFVMDIDPVSNAVNLWKFHVDFVTPKNSTFVGPSPLASVAPFTAPCLTTQDCIPQPGTTSKLDAIGDRMMYRLAYRNFGDHASIVANHTVLAPGGNTAVRWYEIRDPNGTPTIYQQGTFAPDTDSRWMGSIAMDQAGNIGVGYSVASAVTYPSIRFSGWEVGGTPGQLEAETFAVVGSGSQTGYNRWGDYSAMRIDPSDDCTFWYTQEYQAVTDTANWSTRIVSFKFPSCGPSSSPVPTTTTLTSSANPSTYATSVTLTALVSPSSGTGSPTGTVTFFDGAAILGSSAVDATGTATLATKNLTAGAHSIVATYNGNAIYGGSSSPALSQTVNKANTTTTLTSNRNPSTPSQPATFKATISSSTATGTVQFYDGAVLLGTSAVSNGIASLTPSLAVGSHSITAQYSGDVNYNGSASAVVNQTVRRRR
jgi:hypothetical protein